ncbi:MAG: hypothetical protein KKC43_09235 [Alphaproteobacteria bacterium]|nr:hypothetical protein [Alphaproteobacteria bacterium]
MAEMITDLALELVRVRAVIAALKPDLLRDEDPVGNVRAIAELGSVPHAAILVADHREIAEQVEPQRLAHA